MSLRDYIKFLEDLASSKGIPPSSIKQEVNECGEPGLSNSIVNIHYLNK